MFGNRGRLRLPSKPSVNRVTDADDEVITLDSVEPTAPQADNKPPVMHNSPFTGGFVHPSFKNACAPFISRTPETSLLALVVETELAPNEVLIGAIFSRSSFIHKSGGSLLL